MSAVEERKLKRPKNGLKSRGVKRIDEIFINASEPLFNLLPSKL